jgi:septal ring-binding cell division protein DamX
VTDTAGTVAMTTTTTTQAPNTTTTAPAVATTTTAAPAPIAPPPAATATTASATPPNQALPPVVRRTTDAKSRYDAMARDYAANATGNFTVQVQILCETSNLDKAMRDGGERVWFVPQTIGARSCYRVFWGRFATRDAAQQAMSEIPASLRDRSSAVKPVPKP